MTRPLPRVLTAAVLFSLAGMAAAQNRSAPLDDTFQARVSGFDSHADIRFAASGTVTGVGEGETGAAEFDDDGATLEAGSKWRPSIALKWRFSDRQRLLFDYLDFKRSRSEDISGGFAYDGGTFDDGNGNVVEIPAGSYEIPEGTEVSAGTEFKLASVGYEFAVVDTDTFQVGLGLAAYWARLEGDASGSFEGEDYNTRLFNERGVSPAPQVRVQYAPNDQWSFSLLGGGFDTSWGNFTDLDGHFYRASANIEYRFNENFGVNLGYDWFKLKLSDDFVGTDTFGPVEVDGETYGPVTANYDVRGTGTLRVKGPTIGITYNF